MQQAMKMLNSSTPKVNITRTGSTSAISMMVCPSDRLKSLFTSLLTTALGESKKHSEEVMTADR